MQLNLLNRDASTLSFLQIFNFSRPLPFLNGKYSILMPLIYIKKKGEIKYFSLLTNYLGFT